MSAGLCLFLVFTLMYNCFLIKNNLSSVEKYPPPFFVVKKQRKHRHENPNKIPSSVNWIVFDDK